MNKNLKQAIYSAVYRMLRPLVLTLLKQGVSFAEFSDLARRAYIDAATEDLALPDRKQSVSRVSVLTGINRKEIARLQKQPNPVDTGRPSDVNRAYRVVNGWLRDDQFQSDGHPYTLALDGMPAEGSAAKNFSDLVRRYGGDVPWRAVLDELQRMGLIEKNDKEVSLISEGFVPHVNLEEQFRIMGRASHDLLSTVEHNLSHTPSEARIQRTVAYGDIPLEAMASVRTRSREEAEDFLYRTNRWLSKTSTTPGPTGNKRYRAGIGIYYFEDELSEDEK